MAENVEQPAEEVKTVDAEQQSIEEIQTAVEERTEEEVQPEEEIETAEEAGEQITEEVPAEDEKSKILTDLYSLRAGVSAVAAEREKVIEINNSTNKEISALNNEIKNLKYENDTLTNESAGLDDELKKNQRVVDEFKSLEPPTKAKRNKVIKKYVTIWATLCIVLAFYLVYVIMYFLNGAYGDDTHYILTIASCCLAGLIAIFAIPKLAIWTRDDVRCANEAYRSYKKSYALEQSESNESAKRVKQLSKEIDKNVQKISKNERRVTELQNRTEQLKAEAEKARITHYLLGGLIRGGFENEYGNFLSPRDWRYVDIIISSFQSDSVDNIREALSYVDGENKENRIDIALNDGLEKVSRSISEGLDDFSAGMERRFDSVAKLVNERINGISVNYVNYSAYVIKAAKEVNYKIALLQRQNQSCAAMVKENELFLLQARQYMNTVGDVAEN